MTTGAQQYRWKAKDNRKMCGVPDSAGQTQRGQVGLPCIDIIDVETGERFNAVPLVELEPLGDEA